MSANLSGLQSLFAARLSAAIAAAEAATGAKASFLSGRRTAAQGVEIWNRATDFGRHAPSFAAAPPGKSLHEQGMAVDMADGPVRNWVQAHAKEYGLEAATAYDRAHGKWSHDPPHIQLARGTPKTAYDSTLSMWAGDGQRLPPENIPNVAPAAQGPATLRKGMSDRSTNGAVSQLQRQLASHALYNGPIDGKYGPATETAVRNAESMFQLPARDRGVAGPQVQAALGLASPPPPAYAPGGGVMPPPAYSSGGAIMPPQTTPNPATFQQPQRPITPTPAGRGDLAARPYDSGNLYPGITQSDLITGPPDPYTQAAINGGAPGAATLTDGPAPSAGLAQPYGATIGGNPSGPLGMNQDLLGAIGQGSDFPTPSFPAMSASAGLAQPYGAANGGSPFGPVGMDQNLLGVTQPPAPQPPTTAPVSLNDVGRGVAGIPKALGLGDWFGASNAAAADPGVFNRVPSAASEPYGVPSDTVPYSPPSQTLGYSGSGGDNYLVGSGGPFTGTPYRIPSSSYAGNPYDFTGGGASAAGAAETPLFHGQPIGGELAGQNMGPIGGPGVTPAGGEPFSPSMYNAPPDPGTGGSAAMIQPYAGFTPQSAYVPQPAVRLAAASADPVQQATQAAQTGGGHSGAGYGAGGGNNGGGYFGQSPGAYSYAGVTPWGSPSYTTPSGGYSNSPYTPSGQGWQAPNFTPGSGGATYAYQPNGYGGGTFVDSHGNMHSY